MRPHYHGPAYVIFEVLYHNNIQLLMRPGFHHKLVNGILGDPCLYVRIPWEKRALLFDIGDISKLSPSEINRITDVFVTHTHMDHFIGFDMLLRVILRRELPVNIYGPRNIAACIEGKLRGYTWNLISDYPLVINAFAYDGKMLAHSVFRAKNRFLREKSEKMESNGTLLDGPEFSVNAAVLDHGTPCLGFSAEEKQHINIDKDLLLKRGLEVGKWLSDLKRILREEGPESGRSLDVNGRRIDVRELSELAIITGSRKITYATDAAARKKNIAKLTHLAKGADIFFCEAYFMEKDRLRAEDRMHLTAKICGSIAKEAGAKRLEIIHVSPMYSDCPNAVIEEAMAAFSG